MSEIQTTNQGNKTVTAKVTFDKYMELLREAEGKQMSLNQLFLTKLFPIKTEKRLPKSYNEELAKGNFEKPYKPSEYLFRIQMCINWLREIDYRKDNEYTEEEVEATIEFERAFQKYYTKMSRFH